MIESSRGKSKKRIIDRPKVSSKQRFTGSRQKLRRMVASAIAVGAIATGVGVGYNAYQGTRPENQSITISQAIQSGDTLKSLGITKEQQKELQSYQEQLQNEDISNQDLLEITSNIDGLQLGILKNKVGKLLNEDPENIKVKATVNSSDYEESIQVENEYGEVEQNYSSSWTQKILEGKGISGDVSEFIRRIANMQTFVEKAENENFDRSNVMNRVKDEIEATSQFAAGKMQIDDRGNISIDKTKVKDMNMEKDDEER